MVQLLLVILACVGFASTASQTSAADSHTHSTVPSKIRHLLGTSKLLKSEDAARYIAQFQGMVVGGGRRDRRHSDPHPHISYRLSLAATSPSKPGA